MQLATPKAPVVVLWRILGNDIVPRHAPGQTYRNLEFILRNEADFPGCEKRFLLNRIMREDAFERLQSLLQEAHAGYEVIPFESTAYLAQRTIDDRVQYLTNVNAARNHCIKGGLASAPVVLPLDGNCFFSRAGWQSFFAVADRNTTAAAFIVAMWRLRNNQHALDVGRKPRLRETVRQRLGVFPVRVPVEPQVGFTKMSDAWFNENLVYSKCDKVELLWRLGVGGPWDEWHKDLRTRTIEGSAFSKFCGDRQMILNAGFVCRLASGNERADSDIAHRGESRKVGLAEIANQADDMYRRPKSERTI